MIIKLIPETEKEKNNFVETEHTNVKDFFIMGNKHDEGDFVDFHDWNGQYRYLVGSLYYFAVKLEREEESKEGRSDNGLTKMVKYGDANIGMPDDEALDPEEEQEIVRKDLEVLQGKENGDDIEIMLDVNDITKKKED